MTLIFVYNADSGLANTLLDIGHKIISPSTYSCRLCALTHSTFSMRAEWKEFVNGLGVPVEFLHRDEFRNQYGIQAHDLPAIYRKGQQRVEEWLGPAEINTCDSLNQLKTLISDRLLKDRN